MVNILEADGLISKRNNTRRIDLPSMMWLILTTLLHFLSILPLVSTNSILYISVILVSTLLSVLYHLYEESNSWITILDYGMSGVWAFYDTYLGYKYKLLYKILPTSLISCAINVLIPYNRYYTLMHSMWHILNAYKSYYIATLLSKTEL